MTGTQARARMTALLSTRGPIYIPLEMVRLATGRGSVGLCPFRLNPKHVRETCGMCRVATTRPALGSAGNRSLCPFRANPRHVRETCNRQPCARTPRR